ncbi:MAG: endonuclease/exonuclease/phosphatase family protein [Clostridia bacterium]|nr:endonuclease/exonuclease/phosphatase family protein [Clostridia bacterium]
MKKVISAIILIIICFTLVSCAGEAITPNEPYDMGDGIVISEYKEINFTVATYNIQGGEATIESVKEINKNLIDVGADIAGLQEVDNLSKRSGKTDFLEIFREGSLNNVSYFPVMLKNYGDTYGIATVSKTQFLRTHSFKLPYPYKYEKSSVEKRIIMRSLITVDDVQVAFYTTHLSYENVKMADGKSLRETQINYILKLLQNDPCPYKIVTGDFNVLSFEEFEILTKNGYLTVNNSENKFDTYKGNDVEFLAIDNIIYSDRLQLQNSNIFNSDCSDHCMLYATFKTVA